MNGDIVGMNGGELGAQVWITKLWWVCLLKNGNYTFTH